MKQRRVPRRVLADVRVRFASMVDAAASREQVMAALGVGRATYFKWRAAYRSGGLAALAVREVSGGPTKLSAAQESQLRAWIIGADPRQFQIDFGLWTRAIVAEVIRVSFGVEFTPQGVGKLLRRLGFSPQRPLYRAYEQDPAAVQTWTRETFPAIRAQAARWGADLYFGDEAGIRTDHHSGTTWAPIGQTPVITGTGRRHSVNMISAVTPRGELRFATFPGRLTTEVFLDFLRRLVADNPRPVYLIVDNHTVHRAAAVRRYIESTHGQLTLFHLPPYAPELNPDEWVWKNVKNDQVGRTAVIRPTDIVELAARALERLQHAPDTIRGFFRDPALAYITTVR